MKVIDKKIEKTTLYETKTSKKFACTKLKFFHCIYRKFVTKTSTATLLTDWQIKYQKKQGKKKK